MRKTNIITVNMINYTKGDLLSSKAYALVNTVNVVGVMGKGIALHFKNMFPHNFEVYADACRRKEIQIGKMLVVKDCNPELGERLIINFPTKSHWRYPSKYNYIESGLRDLISVIRENHITSIAIPPLGCGNGGLDWSIVKRMIEDALSVIENVDIEVYEPSDEVRSVLANQSYNLDATLTPARAMLLYAMFCYEANAERCSLFVANKLSYFYQILGEKEFERLIFVPHFYGPYCRGVGSMLYAVNGKYIHGLEQMDRKPFEALELDYGRKAEISAYVHEKLSASQRNHIRNLLRIIEGFESAYSMELLASVAYVRKNEPDIDIDTCVQKIQSWSDRKKIMFRPEHIEEAYKHLDILFCHQY